MSIYALKSQFQNLLRPLVSRLHEWGVTANQVTLVACFFSLVLGVGIYAVKPSHVYFGLIPLWMFLRMALNAIDGMLAREHGQASPLGAYLNELCDVISDAALYLPFALVLPGDLVYLGLVIVLSGLSEFAGALGAIVGSKRRYEGPLGKSDRAFVFGVLGFLIALGWQIPSWFVVVMPLLGGLVAWTIVRRVRFALMDLSAA